MIELSDGLREAVFWVAAAAIVIAQAAILRTARAYVAQAPRDRDASPWLEACWAIVPAVGLAAMLVVAWRQR